MATSDLREKSGSSSSANAFSFGAVDCVGTNPPVPVPKADEADAPNPENGVLAAAGVDTLELPKLPKPKATDAPAVLGVDDPKLNELGDADADADAGAPKRIELGVVLPPKRPGAATDPPVLALKPKLIGAAAPVAVAPNVNPPPVDAAGADTWKPKPVGFGPVACVNMANCSFF
jgi:hypothetical protein